MPAIAAFLLLLIVTAGLARLGGQLVIRHAHRLGLLHQPNERSSHQVVVPHGGGLGLVLAFSLALVILNASGAIDWRYAQCVVFAGCLLAALGLWDDISPLPARYRLLGQLVAVMAALVVPGHSVVPDLPFWLWVGIAAVLMLWWLNLFNFMDGIDGLAASEALFICAGASMLIVVRHAPGSDLQLVMLLLMASIAGFLSLNWPPARIFMGDVGSTYLGFVIGVFALDSVSSGQLPFTAWLVLGSVFWVDSSLTLTRRILKGERWHAAHRSHAYQRYASALSLHFRSRGQSPSQCRASAHRAVTMVAMTINILWLLPLAWLVIIEPSWQLAWLGLAWLPLMWLTLYSGLYE